MKKLDPKNLSAQLHYRAAGNPPGTLPASAISNCFPGLEFDFRNVWRRIFVGIEMHEADNYVMKTDKGLEHLLHHRLLRVDGQPLVVPVMGPQRPGADSIQLTNSANPEGVAFMEWSNALAEVLHGKAGKKVRCEFTLAESSLPAAIPTDKKKLIVENLEVRHFFARGTQGQLAVIAEELAQPGELTQGLCSPWQNDYRECACYYWAASRPDYVSVEQGPQGVSVGINWMQKERGPEAPQQYILDNREDSRLVSYDDLFRQWEELLHFQIEGRDRDVVPLPETDVEPSK
ncbi:hypothetical protein JY651_18835 [Pyxidicoccus parkwayensis]|uniref:Uncharacterized protein n=1 Tax=Pyxidicoccus parkwayensis TaxID=2813578 RepID=A0ABX7P8T8_9BACT|nr:hypothetical protein [Pyxidicoccus parkwaysis]QSQ26841.1 hypothetical protein JY651_18835 [Pyxidicoccus parkwaysis]